MRFKVAKDNFRNIAKSRLEQIGYHVSIIPEDNDAKRADLYAKSDSDALIVEVKRRFDDKMLCETVGKTKPREIVPHSKPIKRQSCVTSIIKEASEQVLVTLQMYRNAFGVTWFHPNPMIGFSIADRQIKLNLYGGRYAFVDAPNGSHLCRPCYYSTYSDFYIYRNIDALILDLDDRAQLLPNPFSTKAHAFRKTKLYKDFKCSSAIWTPELQSRKTVLYIKGDIDLKNESLVKYELKKQNPGYKNFRFVQLNSIGGIMKI